MIFPMLFDCGFARHQICSSLSSSRQRSILGRKSSAKWYRQRAMKACPISLMIDEDCAQPSSEQAQREHTRIRGVRVKAIQSDFDVIQTIGEVNRGIDFTGSARVSVAPIS